MLDQALRVISASQSFYRVFGATARDTLGRMLPDIDAHHLDSPALRSFLDRVRSGNDSTGKCEIEIDLPPLGKRTLVVTAEEIRGADPSDKEF